jgi:hypothetical protein
LTNDDMTRSRFRREVLAPALEFAALKMGPLPRDAGPILIEAIAPFAEPSAVILRAWSVDRKTLHEATVRVIKASTWEMGGPEPVLLFEDAEAEEVCILCHEPITVDSDSGYKVAHPDDPDILIPYHSCVGPLKEQE